MVAEKVAGWPTAAVELVVTMVTLRASLIVMAYVAVPVPMAFVALSATDVVPAVVGVPEILPVVAFRLSPAGSGLAVKLVGELEAVIITLNGVPVVPAMASGLFVMTGALPPPPPPPAAATVMVRVVAGELTPVPFVAVIPVTLMVPAVRGVPVMAPVEVLKARPFVGKPVAA